jgi:thiol-disulfide isomerase/thioredoxin
VAPSGAQARRGDRPRRGAGSLTWVLVVVVVALVATVALAVQRRSIARQAATTVAPIGPTKVPAAVMADLEGIPAETWTRIGTADAAPPTFVGDSLSEGGKPVVLYIGAGYCPYCAAARWSMIAAMSRFGRFSDLTYSRSSSVDVFPATPTFSFYGGHYNSDHIAFQSVELASEVLMANGQYQPLETPTSTQEALLNKYDAPPYVPQQGTGGIPFILVGGRYMWSGSPFSPQVLAGRTQADIAATLPQGSGPAAQAILANANILTAAICAVDGNQPTEVCSDPVIRSAMEALPHTAP